MINLHCHPNCSFDGQGTMGEWAVECLKRGITVAAFTPHHILEHPRVGPCGIRGIHNYFKEIDSLNEEFAGRLKILAGVEIDYFQEEENRLESFLEEWPFDFALGSVHLMEFGCGCADVASPAARDFFASIRETDYPAFLKSYFSCVDSAIESGLFDCFAHLSIFSKFSSELRQLEFSDWAEWAPDAVKKAKKRRCFFEINTGLYRKKYGLKRFMPEEDFFALAVSMGMDSFSIGSDAHFVDEVDCGLSEGVQALKRSGARKIVYFEKRKPKFVPIEKV